MQNLHKHHMPAPRLPKISYCMLAIGHSIQHSVLENHRLKQYVAAAIVTCYICTTWLSQALLPSYTTMYTCHHARSTFRCTPDLNSFAFRLLDSSLCGCTAVSRAACCMWMVLKQVMQPGMQLGLKGTSVL